MAPDTWHLAPGTWHLAPGTCTGCCQVVDTARPGKAGVVVGVARDDRLPTDRCEPPTQLCATSRVMIYTGPEFRYCYVIGTCSVARNKLE